MSLTRFSTLVFMPFSYMEESTWRKILGVVELQAAKSWWTVVDFFSEGAKQPRPSLETQTYLVQHLERINSSHHFRLLATARHSTVFPCSTYKINKQAREGNTKSSTTFQCLLMEIIKHEIKNKRHKRWSPIMQQFLQYLSFWIAYNNSKVTASCKCIPDVKQLPLCCLAVAVMNQFGLQPLSWSKFFLLID